MTNARKVELSFSGSHSPKDSEITITSLEDLEALSVKHGYPLVIRVGDDGKLSYVEVYDDYRE